MLYDYNTVFSNRYNSASNTKNFWIETLVYESSHYEHTNFNTSTSDVLDGWGVPVASMTPQPGLMGSSDIESPTDAFTANENRVLVFVANAPYIEGVLLEPHMDWAQNIQNQNLGLANEQLEISEQIQNVSIKELALNSVDVLTDVYVKGRLLYSPSDAKNPVRKADYSYRRNSGSVHLWFDTQGIASSTGHKTVVSRTAFRKHPWTFCTEILDSEIEMNLEKTIHWDGWTSEIIDPSRLFIDLKQRCSLWLVVERPDTNQPLVKLIDDGDWSIPSIDISHGEVNVVVDSLPNWFSTPGGGEVSNIDDSTPVFSKQSGVRAWLVLCDGLQDFEIYPKVDLNSKAFDLNLRNIDSDSLPSFDKNRLQAELSRFSDCPFVPPPLKNISDIEIWGWSGENQASDTRRLSRNEDWEFCDQTAFIAQNGVAPLIHALGGAIYVREPVELETCVWVRFMSPNGMGCDTYDPVGSWQDWSSRINDKDSPPDATDWQGLIVAGDSDIPIVWLDNRVNAMCWVSGLYRPIFKTSEYHGRMAGAGRPDQDPWDSYQSDVVVRHDGRHGWIQNIILTKRNDVEWSEWSNARTNGAISEFYNELATDSEYFGSDVGDQIVTGEGTRPFSVFGESIYANIFQVNLAIDPKKSGSLKAMLQCTVDVSIADFYNTSQVAVYASTDHGEWLEIHRETLTQATETFEIEHVLNNKPVRYRARIVTLPQTRRTPTPNYNDQLNRLQDKNLKADRDWVSSFQQIVYWNRTTAYNFDSDDSSYDRPNSQYVSRDNKSKYLINYDRLTSIVVSPEFSPNNSTNGDNNNPNDLVVKLKDYYAELTEIAADVTGDGPDTSDSGFSTLTVDRNTQSISEITSHAFAITPNYTTVVRWMSYKQGGYDEIIRVNNDDYDGEGVWDLRRYISIKSDEANVNCGRFDDTPTGEMLNDGDIYEWNSLLSADWTDFSLHDIDLDTQQLVASTPLDVLDCGRFPIRV